MTIGEIIKRERQKKGMSMRALAAKADVALTTILNTEKGRHVPTSSTLRSIAEALDLKASDITLESVGDIVKEMDKRKNGMWHG